jgi:hypothetical protein
MVAIAYLNEQDLSVATMMMGGILHGTGDQGGPMDSELCGFPERPASN